MVNKQETLPFTRPRFILGSFGGAEGHEALKAGISKHNCEVHPGAEHKNASASSLRTACKSALNHRGSKELSPRREEGEAGVGWPGGAVPTAMEWGARGGVARAGSLRRARLLRGAVGEPIRATQQHSHRSPSARNSGI